MFDDDSWSSRVGETHSNEIKISVAGLELGMYVTRLERPWVKNAFPPTGLLLEGRDQIELIRKSSHYVYVDPSRGKSPDARYWILEEDLLQLSDLDAEPVDANQQDEYARLKKRFYSVSTELELELETARAVHERMSEDIRHVLDDLQRDKPLDVDRVRDGIVAIVDSVIRNPAALNLLTQLKQADSYTYTHALGTSIWCAQFGRHLGLEPKDMHALALGGMLLDIGKIKIPREVLNKKIGFTEQDLKLIRSHVEHSVQLASEDGSVAPVVLEMIATHHERANGSGYPDGLNNEQIPIFGRIAGIVDSYDAMTSVRPHNPHALTPHEAIAVLYNSSNDLFQPELVEQFIQTIGVYPVGSLVEFKTGQVGVVTAVHDLKRLYPTVMILLDSNKQPLSNFMTIDLSSDAGQELSIAHGLPHGAYGIRMEELFL